MSSPHSASERSCSGSAAGALAGFLLYVHTLSPSVAPILERLTRRIGNIWIFMGARLKKIQIYEKKFFKKSEE